MKIKKEFIGLRMGSRIGLLTIVEGGEELYKKLGLNIFEDETNEGSNDKQRGAKSRRKDDNIEPEVLVRVSERPDENE